VVVISHEGGTIWLFQSTVHLIYGLPCCTRGGVAHSQGWHMPAQPLFLFAFLEYEVSIPPTLPCGDLFRFGFMAGSAQPIPRQYRLICLCAQQLTNR
jgi:hypothetical protein